MFDYWQSLTEFIAHFDVSLSEAPKEGYKSDDRKETAGNVKKGGAIKKGGTNARLSKKS